MTDMLQHAPMHHLGRGEAEAEGLRHADHERAQLHVSGGLQSRQIFKEVNPQGLVLAGGMHATVALDEMQAVPEFDKIVQGPGENIIVDLVREPQTFPRVIAGQWGQEHGRVADDRPHAVAQARQPASCAKKFNWPLEPECGWGPARCGDDAHQPRVPVAVRVLQRELLHPQHGPPPGGDGDRRVESTWTADHGPSARWSSTTRCSSRTQRGWRNGSRNIPRKANKVWPYWAAGRADTVRQWPELFEALMRETNWQTVSIGFESGSDRMLRMLNKECTEEDNYFAIDLLNRDRRRHGGQGPDSRRCSGRNIMLGIPGETREDAFKTMRMVKCTKRILPSISFYAPYPGCALGNQLIAEGKSLMTKENYHRFPDDEKVKGVDYQFYRELMSGKYDEEVNKGLVNVRQTRKNYWDALAKA